MKINRVWAMPNKNTFKIKPIKELIEKYYNPEKIWLNPFSNTNKLGKTKGFEIQEILLVPHGGWHNDTICTVEKYSKGEPK